MELGEKQAIIFKKFDKQGKERSIPLYIIDETTVKDFNDILKKKEEYHKTYFVNRILPKDLLQRLENNYLVNIGPIDKYKSEKELQFNKINYDVEPTYLRDYLKNLKIV